MPKVEMKRWIAFYDESAISTLTGFNTVPLASIDQGTGAYQRVGNQITAKGIYIKGMMHNNAAFTNCLRMCILGHPGDVDMTIAAGEFYKDANNAGGTSILTGGAAGLNAMYYPINNAKFQVLYDRVFTFSPQNTDRNDTLRFRKFVKLNRKIMFEANTSGVNNQNYNYFLLIVSAEGGDDVGLGSTVEFSAQASFFYTDA